MNTDSRFEFDAMVAAYLECAAWSSTPDDENRREFERSTFSDSAWDRARMDCRTFLQGARALVTRLDAEQVGHDLWLTRNGHGAGFWDRGLGHTGEVLSDLARDMGELHVWLNEAGELEITQ